MFYTVTMAQTFAKSNQISQIHNTLIRLLKIKIPWIWIYEENVVSHRSNWRSLRHILYGYYSTESWKTKQNSTSNYTATVPQKTIKSNKLAQIHSTLSRFPKIQSPWIRIWIECCLWLIWLEISRACSTLSPEIEKSNKKAQIHNTLSCFLKIQTPGIRI